MQVGRGVWYTQKCCPVDIQSVYSDTYKLTFSLETDLGQHGHVHISNVSFAYKCVLMVLCGHAWSLRRSPQMMFTKPPGIYLISVSATSRGYPVLLYCLLTPPNPPPLVFRQDVLDTLCCSVHEYPSSTCAIVQPKAHKVLHGSVLSWMVQGRSFSLYLSTDACYESALILICNYSTPRPTPTLMCPLATFSCT